MAKKVFSFKALETDAEVKFLKREVRKTNTNISTVIRQLIRNAMEGKDVDDQTEILKAKLERLEKISLSAVKNASYAKYIALANYSKLVEGDQSEIEKMENSAVEFIKEEMEEI
ncbi:hypothetical protein KKC91_10380 [bacterium]|nr:hypothetical protein [bacterium]